MSHWTNSQRGTTYYHCYSSFLGIILSDLFGNNWPSYDIFLRIKMEVNQRSRILTGLYHISIVMKYCISIIVKVLYIVWYRHIPFPTDANFKNVSLRIRHFTFQISRCLTVTTSNNQDLESDACFLTLDAIPGVKVTHFYE